MGDFTKNLTRKRRRKEKTPTKPDHSTAKSAARSTMDRLLSNGQKRVALRLISDLQSVVDAGGEESPARELWDCQSGCSYCCHLPVETSIPEAVLVARAVESHPDRIAITARIAEAASWTADMTEVELYSSRYPCALLNDEGLCVVYEDRPLACRGYVSTSANICRESFEHPELDDDPNAEGIPSDRYLREILGEVQLNLHGVMVKAGHNGMAFELNSVVHAALGLSDKNDWSVFDACRTLESGRETHEMVLSMVAQLDP